MSELDSLVRGLGDLLTSGLVARKLDQILQKQEQLMATLADVQARLDALTAKVGEIAPVLTQIGDGIAGVAADIQALKDQIGAGTPGITPEEADAVVASLDTTISSLGDAVTGLQSAAASLQAVADAQ